jgi:hypothetical protein
MIDDDDDDCRAISDMNEWQEKPKYSEKTCPVPLCPPQIPHDLTQAAMVRSLRLTTRAMAWPVLSIHVRY